MAIPHAVTTPDDSAWPLKAPAVAPPAAPAAITDDGNSAALNGRTSEQIQQTPSIGAALRQTKSVPDIAALAHRQRFNSPIRPNDPKLKDRPTSEMPEFAKGPLNARSSQGFGVGSGRSSRLSIGLPVIDDSWEDDIDYCYEHAAEADCDYQWDRYSTGEGQAANHEVKDVHPDEDGKEGVCMAQIGLAVEADLESTMNQTSEARWTRSDMTSPRISRPSLLDPAHYSGPNYEASPGGSSSTYDSEAITPQSPAHGLRSNPYSNAFHDPVSFLRSPSFALSPEFETSTLQDCLYEELLADDKMGDQYPLSDDAAVPRPNAAESIRSSDTTLSKCESHNSIVMPGTLLVAEGHESINSASSVPELVHSHARRHDSATIAEDLSEHFATLGVASSSDSQHGVEPSQGLTETLMEPVSESTPTENRFCPPALRRARASSEAAMKVISSVAAKGSPPVIGRIRRINSVSSLRTWQNDQSTQTATPMAI